MGAGPRCGRPLRARSRTRTSPPGPRRRSPDSRELVRALNAVAAGEPASSVLEEALERSGLRAALDDGTEEGGERWANLVELRNHAAEFDELEPPEGLARFLEEVALVSDQDTLEERPERVTLITLHAAKGLEFPVVFMVGLEEGLLPYAPCPRRRAGAGGRAPAHVRGHDPGQGPPVPRPRAASVRVGEWRRRSRTIPLPGRSARGPARGRQRPARPHRPRLGS